MVPLTAKGVFKDGRIELIVVPAGIPSESEVLITFLGGQPSAEQPDPEGNRRRIRTTWRPEPSETSSPWRRKSSR